ncbi:unnamed protein product [Mortierella alpina]
MSHSQTGSWHEQYKDSAHIFAGGLPYNLTEGDVICVFSQFGEIAGINLVRDKDTGKSKGFAFIKYVDQRSTILAVDNLNSAQIGGRTIRVDHVQNYKVPKVFDADGNEIEPDEDMVNNAVPKPIQAEDSDEDGSSESEVDDTGIDIDDPMREYLLKKRRKEARKAKRKAEKEAHSHGGRSESKAERKARKELKKAAKKDKEAKKTADSEDHPKLNPPIQDDAASRSNKEEPLPKEEDEDKDTTSKDVGGDKMSLVNHHSKETVTSSVNKPTTIASSRRSRSRSPVPRRSLSPGYRNRSRSADRYKSSSSSYRNHTTSRSRERRRAGDDDDGYRKRRDDSRDGRRSYRDSDSTEKNRPKYSSSRRRSPSPYSRRGGYDSRASRLRRSRSRSRSRSWSPHGRRTSPDRRRRSRSRSPRRP